MKATITIVGIYVLTMVGGCDGGNSAEIPTESNIDPVPVAELPLLPPRGAIQANLSDQPVSNFPTLTASEFTRDAGLVDFGASPRIPFDEFPLGTIVTRLEQPAFPSLPPATNVHEYSRRQAWNADESLLLVGNVLTDAKTLIPMLPDVPLSSAWNWSNIYSNIIYGIRYNNDKYTEFGYYNTNSETFTLLHDFDGQKCSIGSGEGRLSDDDSKILIHCADGSERTLYTYDLVNNRVADTFEVDSSAGYDWATFSPSGEFILIYYDDQQTRSIYRHLPDFSNPILLGNRLEHGDIGADVYGNELLVMIGFDSLFAIRLRDGATIETPPDAFPDDLGFGHVSCLNIRRPGWCYFSADGSGYLGAIQLSYRSHANTNGAMQFDGNFEQWGWHRSSLSSYERIPKASVSPSGAQLIFTTDSYGQTEANDVVVTFPTSGVAWPDLISQ